MGCTQSCEKAMSKTNRPYGYERLESLPTTPRMAPSNAVAVSSSTSHLSSQHERLILELLPFKDAAKFQEWLQSQYVRGPWAEFCRDFLVKNPAVPEPDKQKTAQAAKDAINGRNAKYMVYFPDKQGWTTEDHHIRFICTIVSDNMLKNLWSDSDWKKKGIDIAKAVYEVLSFLRASYYVTDQNPPGYTV
jgi:hypothetical protein